MDTEGLIKLAIVVLFLLLALVRWIVGRARLARGEPLEGPPPEEPKLPYEDVIDEVFGPYIRRRRREYEEAQARGEGARPEGIEFVEGPEPQAPRVVPGPPPESPPGPLAAPLAPLAAAGEPAAVGEPAAPRRGPLEERLFANPRWGAAAKLVVSAEILGRPKFLRRPPGMGRP